MTEDVQLRLFITRNGSFEPFADHFQFIKNKLKENKKMAMYKCVYCGANSKTFTEITKHIIESHSEREIKFEKTDDKTLKILNYKVIPELVYEQGRTITINEKEQKIHLSKMNVFPKESPLKKIFKSDIENLDSESSDYVSVFEDENTSCNANEEVGVEHDTVVSDLISLLPGAVENLRDNGKLDEYIAFTRLLSERKFPLTNIAFVLFMDVVRWFKLEKSTTLMRYSDNVKLFWRTGMRLFHGRFLKFMAGPKHSGQITSNETSKGYFDPSTSKINFAVPSISVLKDEDIMVDEKQTGILDKMITKIAINDSQQQTTYKLCVDGKKVNPCSSGEVDLWGYEDRPTYQEKQTRLQEDLNHFQNMKAAIERMVEHGHSVLDNISEDERNKITQQIKFSVKILSHRLRDLRQRKLKKEIFLRKMMERCQSDWRNSQYAMLISSLKTSIYQIDNCIEDLLICNEKLLYHAANLQDTTYLMSQNHSIDMLSQRNVVCLGESTDPAMDPCIIKQRSDAWFKVREQSLITGSTINKAIGLDGLKSQKSFLHNKKGSKSLDPVSEDLQKKFDYGKDNETNAVATYVSTYLPAFHPEYEFYEEGCYVVKEKGTPMLVVSPDGSIRNQQGKTVYGVEIKCPFPGKLYSTPIQYSLPHYYVTQILSEMWALEVDSLYFLSYSKESMAIHVAHFDEDLWNTIYEEANEISSSAKIPTKLKEKVHKLRKIIANYCMSSVEFIAEIKSKISIDCKHDVNKTGRIYHNIDGQKDELQTAENCSKLLTTLLRCVANIQESHKLCVLKASEVLVFILSDLDRVHKLEIPNSFPVAYAFKGYSMKSEILRSMIKDVLLTLFQKGFYTPVISYDGQWSKLAFQTAEDESLTMLELQKKIYNEVKSRKKGDMLKAIFAAGVFEQNSCQRFACHNRRSAIELGYRSSEKVYKTSEHVAKLLKSLKQCASQAKQLDDYDSNENVNYNLDHVLANVPHEVVSSCDDEPISKLENVIKSTVNTGFEPVVDYTNVTSIFDESDSLHSSLSVSDQLVYADDSEAEGNIATNKRHENKECLKETDSNKFDESDSLHSSLSVSDQLVYSDDSEAEGNIATNKRQKNKECLMETDSNVSTFPKQSDVVLILQALQKNDKSMLKWSRIQYSEFSGIFQTTGGVQHSMTKEDILVCLETISKIKSPKNTLFYKSWNKKRLAETLVDFLRCSFVAPSKREKGPKKRKRPDSLINLCKKTIKSFPKYVLNVIISEHEFEERLNSWREGSPFSFEIAIGDIGNIVWFSKPEYNIDTFSYIFSFLDMHHLITNCRIKVCKDGFSERGISNQAWIAVARENCTNLRVSHVEDLIDKQSDAIARETFSKDVELCMLSKGFLNEAHFCSLIREFYEAEDDPGLSAFERCRRRLNLRQWLLEGVNFNMFPPYGSYIRGIPHVMFQGFLTNIDRRIQLFPFVKSGSYNVRALGSLEVENFFGEFQDLDPKGSGIIKADEVPAALESACQLLKTRLMPDRPFHMVLSKAKVYPVQGLDTNTGSNKQPVFINPTHIESINIRNHHFDDIERQKRKSKRRLVKVTGPDEAARGAKPVRQYHKCDESKILPHKRLGIDFQD